MVRVIDLVWKNRGLPFIFFVYVMMMTGCGVKVAPLALTYEDHECRQMWLAVEEAIQEEEAADAEVAKVKGYPYLRSSRYLQALAELAATQEEKQYVLEEMRQLDLEKRALELQKIAAGEERSDLVQWRGHASLLKKMDACSQGFLADDKNEEGFFEKVKSGISLDRDYSLWLRSVGLYPITSIVVDIVAQNAQDEMVANFSRPATKKRQDETTFKGPQHIMSDAEVAGILQKSRQGPFGSHHLSPKDRLVLAKRFAPLLTISSKKNHDKFGRIIKEKDRFKVDHQTPAAYYYFSQTFIQGSPALQVNYVIWFAERAKPAPWFEQGDFDGLTFRYTLAPNGQPIFVDVMLNCGCYHFALYDNRRVKGLLQDTKGLQLTVGGQMPQLQKNEHVHFKITPGWHQIDQIYSSPGTAANLNYQLRPYEELEYVVGKEGAGSLFDSHGRVPGSSRLERFFLFPMGIPKVGSMRQRGRQPITLIGRSYFDDPYLFDRSFSYRNHDAVRATNEIQGR